MQNSTMKLTATAFSALLVGMSAVSPVAAEDEDIGYYFGLELGVTSTPDRNISGLGGTPLIRADLDRGYVYGGVIGYDFGNFAAELEILRFGQDISTLNTLVDGGLGASLGGAALTPGAVAATGEVNGSSWMLNGIYQFENDSTWTPFVGVGLGATYLTLKNAAVNGATYAAGRDWVATVQGIAGIEKRVSDTTALRLSYRYSWSEKADVLMPGPSQAQYGHRGQALMLGFTYSLGSGRPKSTVEPMPAQPEPAPVEDVVQMPAPQPEPMPAPEPEPVVIPGPFQVFFDWDSATLTPQAMNIIRDAASAYAEYGPDGVVAVGHTDRSGPEWYNDRLSMRRVVAVREALVSLGVPLDAIDIGSRGERDNLVSTPDGVREPRNRRVLITLSMQD